MLNIDFVERGKLADLEKNRHSEHRKKRSTLSSCDIIIAQELNPSHRDRKTCSHHCITLTPPTTSFSRGVGRDGLGRDGLGRDKREPGYKGGTFNYKRHSWCFGRGVSSPSARSLALIVALIFSAGAPATLSTNVYHIPL